MEFRKMVMITLYARQQKRHRCIECSWSGHMFRRFTEFVELKGSLESIQLNPFILWMGKLRPVNCPRSQWVHSRTRLITRRLHLLPKVATFAPTMANESSFPNGLPSDNTAISLKSLFEPAKQRANNLI